MSNESYLECGLPEYLQESIDGWIKGQDNPMRWDAYFGDLQSSINCAEVGAEISSKQAWYLREKYLGMSEKENRGDYVEGE